MPDDGTLTVTMKYGDRVRVRVMVDGKPLDCWVTFQRKEGSDEVRASFSAPRTMLIDRESRVNRPPTEPKAHNGRNLRYKNHQRG